MHNVTVPLALCCLLALSKLVSNNDIPIKQEVDEVEETPEEHAKDEL